MNFLKLFFSIMAFTTLLSADEMKEPGQIKFEFTVNASPEDVYKVWTTKEGLESFFAPECKVDLNLFGDFHIYFFPENPAGSKGAEDEKVISFEENKMFSFTWGFPPSLPYLRANQKTIVTLRFYPEDNGKTKVVFTQSGWGFSEDWMKGFTYFTNAWGKVVLARLQYRFAEGPIDWKNEQDYSGFSLIKK